MNSIYVIGSLRNPIIPEIGNKIRELGMEAFDDWFAAGPHADDCWRDYEKSKGNNYRQGLEGYAAKHVFSFDKHHLDRTDGAVLILPAGRSGHMELCYTVGRGKPSYILLDQDPERWDVMYQFATKIFYTQEEMLDELKRVSEVVPRGQRQVVEGHNYWETPESEQRRINCVDSLRTIRDVRRRAEELYGQALASQESGRG